jgi:hypothetical protein
MNFQKDYLNGKEWMEQQLIPGCRFQRRTTDGLPLHRQSRRVPTLIGTRSALCMSTRDHKGRFVKSGYLAFPDHDDIAHFLGQETAARRRYHPPRTRSCFLFCQRLRGFRRESTCSGGDVAAVHKNHCRAHESPSNPQSSMSDRARFLRRFVRSGPNSSKSRCR